MDEQHKRISKKAKLLRVTDLHSQISSQERRREDALKGIKNGTVDFEDLSEELRDDAEIALAAISEDLFDTPESISSRLWNDKEFVLAAVKEWGMFLKYASEELRADREVVGVAVKQSGHALQFASRELRGIREVVLAAVVRQNGSAIQFASRELRADGEIVLEAVRQYGCALEFASEDLRADREIVLTAVRQNIFALFHASEELRGDREVILTMVRQCGTALEFASDELRNDREIVLEAVRQDSLALEWASEELCGDREVVMEAVGNRGTALRYASEELQGDREIVLAAIQRHGAQCFQFASEELQANQEIVLSVVENTVLADDVLTYILPNMSNDLKNDPVVVGAILRKGVPLQSGSKVVERLENVLLAARVLPKAFVGNVINEESVVEFSRRWGSSVWHKIWMALLLEPPGMQGTGRLFVELSGLPLELRQTKELRTLAPVIGGVLSAPDVDWRDLNSYPQQEEWDESDPEW